MSAPELEHTVTELVRQVEHRYHGKYRGLVVDNADPEHIGRLRVKVPSVLGDEVVTGWATPCVPFGGQPGQGLFAVPDTDAGVWVEFEEGDLEFPVWVGTFWSKPGGTSEVPKARDRDGTLGDAPEPATRRILTTARGHTVQISDVEGEDMILVHEAANQHTVVLDKAGVTVSDGRGHTISTTEKGITISTKKDLTIDVTGTVTITAASVKFEKKQG